jgi:hypothetical protein
MKEHPLLFSGPMVRALLAGSKTMTRRLVRRPVNRAKQPLQCDRCWREAVPHNGSAAVFGGPCYLRVAACEHEGGTGNSGERVGPVWAKGDRIWVKETWQPLWADPDRAPASLKTSAGWRIGYVATDGIQEYHHPDHGLVTTCKPSIFMPRWAARILLDVEDVRVERVQAIPEEEIAAEGVTREVAAELSGLTLDEVPSLRDAWRVGWQAINGVPSWEQNPWVFAISFRRVS